MAEEGKTKKKTSVIEEAKYKELEEKLARLSETLEDTERERDDLREAILEDEKNASGIRRRHDTQILQQKDVALLEGQVAQLRELLEETQRERDRLASAPPAPGKPADAGSEDMSILEQKVKRLAASLEETAKERDQQKKMLEAMQAAADQGIKGNMMIGLSDEDPDKERKMALLKNIFDDIKSIIYDIRH